MRLPMQKSGRRRNEATPSEAKNGFIQVSATSAGFFRKFKSFFHYHLPTHWAQTGVPLLYTMHDYHHQSIAIGSMTCVCAFCEAKKWVKERAGLCCINNKIIPLQLPTPPQSLQTLLTGANRDSKHILKHVHMCNSAFQMTSFGAKEEQIQGFMPTFKVHGQIYPSIDSLLPEEGDAHKFLQTYLMGTAGLQLDRRCAIFDGIDRIVATDLQSMLHNRNRYI